MRGEHTSDEIDEWSRKGSSPHARGTLRSWLKDIFGHGIIPACAGNTHPHRTVMSRGSSPHTRGTPKWKGLTMQKGGIIPACAGNTKDLTGAPFLGRDHPRMRGEHYSS